MTGFAIRDRGFNRENESNNTFPVKTEAFRSGTILLPNVSSGVLAKSVHQSFEE
jgi:hypothetical protein